mmetsp:Transcript_12732/g.27579  ORF Transcript_12732/g.27579 Transcript_12732/m.27579 type:complete len:202 (-) Transcript_12732:2-607(-)
MAHASLDREGMRALRSAMPTSRSHEERRKRRKAALTSLTSRANVQRSERSLPSRYRGRRCAGPAAGSGAEEDAALASRASGRQVYAMCSELRSSSGSVAPSNSACKSCCSVPAASSEIVGRTQTSRPATTIKLTSVALPGDAPPSNFFNTSALLSRGFPVKNWGCSWTVTPDLLCSIRSLCAGPFARATESAIYYDKLETM